METMIKNKKVASSNRKNRIKLNTMGNSLNYRDLAYQKMQGISYDELLELQSETGISIQQLEFMYYSL